MTLSKDNKTIKYYKPESKLVTQTHRKGMLTKTVKELGKLSFNTKKSQTEYYGL